MGMEETPSPQSVGREFVRQYYTLMNEAPKYLHRFYSTSSSFIHGGVDKPGQEDKPIYGQKEIHKKIQELNFADCHTKIRQVDSQATVGDAVVVQVTGELSNRGGAMRRFMQTFVLAHQNPKQYYVHNDIFRYQDEVFDSYESEDEGDSQTTQPNNVIENGHDASDDLNHLAEKSVAASPPAALKDSPMKQPDPQASPVKPVQQAPPPQQQPAVSSPPPAQEKPPTESQPDPAKQPAQKKQDAKPEPEIPVSQPAEPAAPAPEKPFSWAARVSSKPSAGSSTATVAVVPPMNSVQTPLAVISAQQKDEENSAPAAPVQDEQVTSSQPPKSNRASAEPGARRAPRPETSREDRRERQNERFPDNQQVFVGNLPQDIADLALKRFFQQYGKVIDIRINRGAASSKVPFGFVVFDNEEPVKELLKLKRVEMDGHRLNVEEKKSRGDRAGSNSRAPRGTKQQRAGSKPKDRENSGSRADNKPPQNRNAFPPRR